MDIQDHFSKFSNSIKSEDVSSCCSLMKLFSPLIAFPRLSSVPIRERCLSSSLEPIACELRSFRPNTDIDLSWLEYYRNFIEAQMYLSVGQGIRAISCHGECINILAVLIKDQKYFAILHGLTRQASREMRVLACLCHKKYECHRFNMNNVVRSIAIADECMFKLFRAGAAQSTTQYGSITYGIGNQMLKMHSRMRNSGRSKAIVKTMDELSKRRGMKGDNLPDIVTFNYFAAKIFLMVGQSDVANDLLKTALKSCHKKAKRNRKLIIELLVPLRLVREGLLPKRKSLAKFGLNHIDDMMTSFRKGDISAYEQAVDELCLRSRDISFANLWMSSTLFVYRNWLRRLSKISGRSRFQFSLLSHLISTVPVVPGDEMDGGVLLARSEEELISLILELIQQGFLKARMSSQAKRRLLMRKYEPFPKVADVINASNNSA